MKKVVKKQTKSAKMTATGRKRPMTASQRQKSPRQQWPTPYGMSQTHLKFANPGTDHENDYMARNHGYTSSYASMDLRRDVPSAYSGTNPPADALIGRYQEQNRDEIDIRPSPKRNRSKSPLRTNPPEVFSRSPRASRHYEEPMQSARAAARNESPRGEPPLQRDERPQQQAQHMSAPSQPESRNTEACLEWLHRNCFREIIQIEKGLEERKVALAERPDFSLD